MNHARLQTLPQGGRRHQGVSPTYIYIYIIHICTCSTANYDDPAQGINHPCLIYPNLGYLCTNLSLRNNVTENEKQTMEKSIPIPLNHLTIEIKKSSQNPIELLCFPPPTPRHPLRSTAIPGRPPGPAIASDTAPPAPHSSPPGLRPTPRWRNGGGCAGWASPGGPGTGGCPDWKLPGKKEHGIFGMGFFGLGDDGFLFCYGIIESWDFDWTSVRF